MKREHYGAIDGLRTIAAIGIVMMHIRANNNYAISGFIYDTVIASFTNFVFLFMTVSAFGMCCGYYEKVLTNQISISDFYKKRIQKMRPFFAVLPRGGGGLENRFTKFFSSISMEVYLCHMFVFRVVEKLRLSSVFGSGWLQYAVTVFLTLIGAAAFALVVQKLIGLLRSRFLKEEKIGS